MATMKTEQVPTGCHTSQMLQTDSWSVVYQLWKPNSSGQLIITHWQYRLDWTL